MKIKVIYLFFMAALIFSSCTTTLQQRRVADELYEDPDSWLTGQNAYFGQSGDQYETSKDTLDQKDYERNCTLNWDLRSVKIQK